MRLMAQETRVQYGSVPRSLGGHAGLLGHHCGTPGDPCMEEVWVRLAHPNQIVATIIAWAKYRRVSGKRGKRLLHIGQWQARAIAADQHHCIKTSFGGLGKGAQQPFAKMGAMLWEQERLWAQLAEVCSRRLRPE